MAKAPPDIRSLARSHTDLAINTLAGIARMGKNENARVNAANALLDRGYGKAATDPEGREHINVTIRKILEGGAITVIEQTPSQVIEHDDAEIRQNETNDHQHGGNDVDIDTTDKRN